MPNPSLPPPVLYSVTDQIGTITLNRPDNRNSMDPELLPAFKAIVAQARQDQALRCLVITGSGNTFCGGGDFKQNFLHTDSDPLEEQLLKIYEPFLEVSRLEMPVVAAMNGHAIGGGLGLALMCDIRVANREARYGANFARLGFSSGMAVSYILPRLVGVSTASELLFTGRIITGHDAFSIGLVNYALDESEVLSKSMALAREIAAGAPVAVRLMKRSLYQGVNWDIHEAVKMEAKAQARTFAMEDAKEGISALLEKRQPKFKGC